MFMFQDSAKLFPNILLPKHIWNSRVQEFPFFCLFDNLLIFAYLMVIVITFFGMGLIGVGTILIHFIFFVEWHRLDPFFPSRINYIAI